MTRTSHKAHPTPQFPVYCLDWADDEALILGGGGGATKSGIENKIVRPPLDPQAPVIADESEIMQGLDRRNKGQIYLRDQTEQRRGCAYDTGCRSSCG
jgi:hypothetical protein